MKGPSRSLAPERCHYRLQGLRARLNDIGAAAFLVTSPVSVRYLTGFESSNVAIVVDRERAVLLTDGRYIEAARALAGMEVMLAERDLAADLGSRLRELTEGPLAFEADRLSVAEHARIAESRVELVPAERTVETLRAVKDGEELEAVRRSASILNEAFERLGMERLTGRSEAEVAWWLERSLRDLGADGLSFDPIVASGPNAALPHHHPGGRVIEPGETVVVDAGCRVDAYCSDCTRTFATGRLPAELLRAYKTCLDAQVAALAAVRAGAACSEIDGSRAVCSRRPVARCSTTSATGSASRSTSFRSLPGPRPRCSRRATS